MLVTVHGIEGVVDIERDRGRRATVIRCLVRQSPAVRNVDGGTNGDIGSETSPQSARKANAAAVRNGRYPSFEYQIVASGSVTVTP